MDSRSRAAATSTDLRVQGALHDYFARLDRGEPIDVEAFVSAHPDVAAELRSFIAFDEEARRLAGGPPGGQPAASQSAFPRPKAELTTHSVAGPSDRTSTGQAPSAAASPAPWLAADLPVEFGRYRVQEILGAGAMGAVYLAQDTLLPRKVALKIPTFDHDPDGELLRRFHREANAVANLKHPNLCAVYDVGEIDGRHYISMEFVAGKKLQDFIQPGQLLAEKRAAAVVRKIALGMQEAHLHGVIHRDLKPDNIMLSEKGEPVVMDFGLARRLQAGDSIRLTQLGTLVGSPAYMSKEQVEGDSEKLTGATDQYSLGVILYQLLTARLPFEGGLHAVLGAILTKEPLPLREYRPDINPHLEAVCLKMMAKAPDDRYPSMKAAAEALAAVENGNSAATASAVTANSAAGLTFLESSRRSPARQGESKSLRSVAYIGIAAGLVLLAGWIIKITRPDGTEIKFSILPKDRIEFGVDAAPPVAPAADRHVPAETDDWVEQVAALPAGEQVQAVTTKLRELNPRFDGGESHTLDGDSVTSLIIRTDHVASISPIRALRDLTLLALDGSEPGKGQVVDLAPLRGLPLRTLRVSCNALSDLSPVAELPNLTDFNCGYTQVLDLSPLRGLKLTSFHCAGTRISNLGPLADMPLTFLNCSSTQVFDLSPLQQMPLRELWCFNTPLSTLAALEGLRLTNLDCSSTQISDLEPLRKMQLKVLSLLGTSVTDLSPLEGMPLFKLGIAKTQVSSLAPLRGMRLDILDCSETQVFDLSPLREMRLTSLLVAGSQVTDLTPLAGMALTNGFFDARQHGLAPLRGMPFRNLVVHNFEAARDLDILRSMTQLETVNDVPAKQFLENASRPVSAARQGNRANGSQQSAAAKSGVAETSSTRPAGDAREVELPGGVRLRQLWCPPGKFTMGSGAAEWAHQGNEGPVFVSLSNGFWLGQTEVTQGQWGAVMGTQPWVTHGDPNHVKTGGNDPAVYINHFEATEFCDKLNELERKAGRLLQGWRYALPTEAQWQYACRGGTDTVFSFGPTEERLSEYAWHLWNTRDAGEPYAHPVAGKKPNAWGFHDMHGNAEEWCRDGYREQLPGGQDPFVAPETAAGNRVHPGGGWFSLGIFCRSASRSSAVPDFRFFYTGFRLALVSDASD